MNDPIITQDDQKTERRISRRRALFGLASAGVGAAAAPILAAGCGGSDLGGGNGAGNSAAGEGAATLSIAWPISTTRLIPTASNSIRVAFLSGATTVASQVVARPSSGTTSTVSFTGLPTGALTLTAEAFPTTGGSGTAQASATQAVTIVAGSTAALAITMGTTIAALAVSPAAPSVTVGGTAQLAVSATNASGAVVLTAASTVTWTSSTPSVASVSATGLVTGLASGTATITVTESESGRSATTTLTVAATVTSCHLIPSETDGPYPLYTVLANSAMMRSSIAETKTGVPLTIELQLVGVNGQCAVIPDAYVYIWHCDKDGQYSGYSSNQNGNHAGETFLRGIQKTDASGKATFTTIYPGWYNGRITHVHFQVYLATPSQGRQNVTSQFGFEPSITQAVYASTLYASHGQNTSVTSFAQDNVFSDGTTYQIATVTGSVSAGYVARLAIGINT